MSMFYELMMRKKTEMMYATIKGSLTENDGVFSGFSSSNYLVLQNDITEFPTNFELQTRISIPSTNSGFAIHFLSYSGNSSGIRVFSPGKLNFYSKNNDNNAVEIIGTTVLSLDTFYFIKIKKVGNTITLYSSLDGNNWTTEGTTTTSSTIPLTSKIGFGHCGNPNNNNYIFNGSIDLNNSYIKLGSTKYNLQAVVGYTIVGSPTIVDGVVTDFSSSNYLKIDKTITANKIEISVSFSFNAINWNDIFWGMSSNQLSLLAELNNSGSLIFYFRQGFSSGNINSYTSLSINTNYRVNITLTYDNFAYKIINEDTNTVVKESTIERTTKAAPYLDIPAFGRSAPNSKIVIKDTTIKADNKLWFNGQQA